MSGLIGGAGSRSGIIGETEIDYEEGTFAVTTNCGSGSVTASASHPLSYTKIGNMVHLRGALVASSHSSPSGTFTINLPFAVAALTGASDYCVGLATAGSIGAMNSACPLTIFSSGNETTMGFQEWTTTGSTGADVAALMASNQQLYISFDYPTPL